MRVMLAAGVMLAGLMAPAWAQDVPMGQQLFGRCAICHDVGPGAKNRVGPVLNGIVGRPAASYPGFPYSPALLAAGKDGLVWTEEVLTGYLAGPKDFVHGVGMAFRGFKSDEDIADVVAYLKTLTN